MLDLFPSSLSIFKDVLYDILIDWFCLFILYLRYRIISISRFLPQQQAVTYVSRLQCVQVYIYISFFYRYPVIVWNLLFSYEEIDTLSII